MFFPWYPAIMLAVEANNVIDIRMRKVAMASPTEAFVELGLMVTEKVAASMHTATLLMFGGSAADVVKHYRTEVAANATRLASQP